MPSTPNDFNDSLNRALKYQADYTHTDFHRKILENTKERTPVLVYADWLQENGKPSLAEHLRSGLDEFTGVMHYDHKTAADGVTAPNTVFYYRGIDKQVGRKKNVPHYIVSVMSPHPAGVGVLSFNSDYLPEEHATKLVKALLGEGHPAGNESAAYYAPSKVEGKG